MKRRPLGDPTIPRKGSRSGNASQRAQVDGPGWGYLVDYGGTVGVMLVDSRGNSWTRDSVRAICGSFGNPTEGFHRAPRAWKYDPAGIPIVRGDTFLIVFLHNDPTKPVLIGGAGSLDPDDPAFIPRQPLGEDPNPGRLRMVQRDAAGVVTGHLQVTALDGGRSFELVVGGAAFGDGLRLQIDHTAGTIKIGAGGESYSVPRGEEIVEAIKGLAIDLQTVAGAASVTPVYAADIQASAEASLEAGAPMLSNIVRVE